MGRGARGAATRAAAAVLAAAPLVLGGDYGLYVAASACLFASLTLAWALAAWCGLFSFGQAAFFGAGAYAAALLAMRAGLSPWIGLAGGAAVAAGVALALGAACLHLRGPYFSLASLAAAEILRIVVTNWETLTDGAQGIVGIPGLPPVALGPFILDAGSRRGAYALALAILAVLYACTGLLRRGAPGAAWAALRENEERAESLGVPVLRWKLLALLVSAAGTGLAGASYAHLLRHIDPSTAFHTQFSVLPLVMGFVGGMDHRAGPVGGAAALYLFNELVLLRWMPTFHLFFYAVAIGLVILYFPRGLLGWLSPTALSPVRGPRPWTREPGPGTQDRGGNHA